MKKLLAKLAYSLLKKEILTLAITDILDNVSTEDLLQAKRDHNYIYGRL